MFSKFTRAERWASICGQTAARGGFDPHPGRTSLAWEVSEDRLSAVHKCVEDAPATLLGARGYERGDHEVTFRLEQLPAAGMIQCGLSNTDHLLDNELGWRNSVGVGPDGFVRLGGVRTAIEIGPVRERDTVAVRLKHGHAYFRRGPTGLWNGDLAADPDRDRGGLLLGLASELHPAVYAERPGTRVCADFSRWAEAIPRPPPSFSFELFDLAASLGRGRCSDDDWRRAGGD